VKSVNKMDKKKAAPVDDGGTEDDGSEDNDGDDLEDLSEESAKSILRRFLLEERSTQKSMISSTKNDTFLSKEKSEGKRRIDFAPGVTDEEIEVAEKKHIGRPLGRPKTPERIARDAANLERIKNELAQHELDMDAYKKDNVHADTKVVHTKNDVPWVTEHNYSKKEDELPEPPMYVPSAPSVNDGLPDSKNKEINYRTTGGFFSIGRMRKRIKLIFKSDKVYLINMELSNGFHATFIVSEDGGGFKYNGKRYIFDDALKYWHLTSGLYAYNYHEGFALPIIAKIDLNEINKAVSGSGITEIEYMTNPITLERFTVSKIAEGIMKGQQLDAFFRQIRLLIIITLLVASLNLILFVFKTGMLKQIKIPGLG
jgi:hypothetical protein